MASIKAIFIISIIVLSTVSFMPSTFALELQRPHHTIDINHRTDYAETNHEVTVGVGAHIWQYEENNPDRGDNVELRIFGSANSRQIIEYLCEEDYYNWHDVYYTLELGDDEVIRVGLQVPVRFYGGRGPKSHLGEPGSFEYTSIWICSNGWISFYDPTKPTPLADRRILIPYEGQANAVVAPFSRDLKPNLGGAIKFGMVEHSSVHFSQKRWCFCVSWENVPDATGNLQSFQVLLEQQPGGPGGIYSTPRQSFIWFQYKQITLDKPTTVGIEDQQGGKYTTYNYQNLGNGKTLVFRVGPTSAEIESITIRLIENEASAYTDIVDDEQWIRGYNVVLKKPVATPDLSMRFYKALYGAGSLCLGAWGIVGSVPLYLKGGALAIGATFLCLELADMAAKAMEIAQLSTDSLTYATANANGTVTDAWFGIVAFWMFTDDHSVDHSLKIEVEVKYCKRNSYYGDIIASGLTHKTSVNLKFNYKDYNNSLSTAQIIDAFKWYEWLYLSDIDKEDYYKIWVKQGQRLSVMMMPPPDVDFDLYLIDKYGVIQASSEKRGFATEGASIISSYEGWWYIKIRQFEDHGYYGLTGEINYPGGGGGCPILSVYNGLAFAVEGLLDIHNPNYIDVIREYTLTTTPQPINYTYLLRLTEHPKTHSYIDQVKLYAILKNNILIQLPLISAIHSEYGNVLPQLLSSDDVRTDTEARQTIDLKFLALPPFIKVESFLFTIEGHNPSYKE
ncbi:MAG: hypothetical protein QXX08_10610 [Candidatus Bathyarchaeia archaeon]